MANQNTVFATIQIGDRSHQVVERVMEGTWVRSEAVIGHIWKELTHGDFMSDKTGLATFWDLGDAVSAVISAC